MRMLRLHPFCFFASGRHVKESPGPKLIMKTAIISLLGIGLALSGCSPSRPVEISAVQGDLEPSVDSPAAGRDRLSGASPQDWPQWRGPHFNGSSTVTGLPAQWSKTENVAWTVDMPGPSAATPVIWGDHVFVSSTDEGTRELHAICVDRKTGKTRWQHSVGIGYAQDNRSNFASPSAAADGERVIFFYGNGVLVAFDFDGGELWRRNIQEDYGHFAFLWTFSTSPVLFDGKLYLQVLQRDVPVSGRGSKPSGIESYLLAMDPQTGKTLWQVTRPSDAVAESREAFTTPIPFEFQGRKELLIAGGDSLTGHNPATGEELWSWGTWNPTRIGHWRLVPSPVVSENIILVCAPKRDPVYGIKAGGIGRLDDSAIAWKSDPRKDNVSSDVPTPLFYDGDFFVLGDLHRSLARIEPSTGRIKWSIETPGRSKYEASPTGVDGKIYLMNFAGQVTVVNAEDGEILHTVAMGEAGDDHTRSTIAVAHGQLFIRTNGKLFCIGTPAAAGSVSGNTPAAE
jgi:outer membrane protein assembly factor BamB